MMPSARPVAGTKVTSAASALAVMAEFKWGVIWRIVMSWDESKVD
jgi:hypothetical protein